MTEKPANSFQEKTLEASTWGERFLNLTKIFASWSKDPSTKVGCVVVGKDRKILATGFNGFPRGVEDSIERLIDSDVKYLFTVHAEANAVAHAAKSGTSIQGATIFISHPPCAQCAALLVQAGIAEVYWQGELRPHWEDSAAVARKILSEAGVLHAKMVCLPVDHPD